MSVELEFRLDPSAIRPLVAHVRSLLSELSDELAAPNEAPVDDEIMTDFWARDLLNSQRKDIAVIAALFSDAFFKTGRAVVDESEVDRVLRGCTAVRLKLRETTLATIDDKDLETGGVSSIELTEEQESGYGAYILFASLQELIISELDP